MRNRSWLVVAAVSLTAVCFVVVMLYGVTAALPAGRIQVLHFSSDSTLVASLWVTDYYGIQFNPGGPNPKSQTAWVCYADVSAPAKGYRIDIDKRNGFGITETLQLRIAPDGRHIGVAALGRLWCIDAQANRKWPVIPETQHVTSLAWRDSHNLVFTAFSAAAKPEDSACNVMRYDVRQPAAGPVLLGTIQRFRGRAETYIPGSGCGRDDVWSPNGRYLIYNDGEINSGNLRMFDAQTATSTILVPQSRLNFGLIGTLAQQLSWKIDESEAVIALRRGTPPLFFHVALPAGKVTDLSAEFAAIAGPDYTSLPSLWTADGYVLHTSSTVGWTLLQPLPWKTMTILGTADPNRFDQTLSHMHQAGWVKTGDTIRDYSGKSVLVLSDMNDVISPDGRWVASASAKDGHAILEPLNVPLPTASLQKAAP